MKQILISIRNLIYGKSFVSKSPKKRDYFLVPVYALLIAVIIRSLLFDNFHIPSGSMKNTLLIGDKITILKFSYGYSRYSFPFGLAPIKGRIFSKAPARGDIIVFKFPGNTRINYVKRLIGLPGDAIRIQAGNLYINGEKIPRKFLEIIQDSESGTLIKLSKFEETLPEGKKIHILKYYLHGEGPGDNTQEFIIPENNYFFMGDNRDFSLDSRFIEVGYVSENLLLGKVVTILISSEHSLLNVFAWPSIRFNRILKNPNK